MAVELCPVCYSPTGKVLAYLPTSVEAALQLWGTDIPILLVADATVTAALTVLGVEVHPTPASLAGHLAVLRNPSLTWQTIVTALPSGTTVPYSVAYRYIPDLSLEHLGQELECATPTGSTTLLIDAVPLPAELLALHARTYN
jgi:hypothetical protein